MAGEEPSAPGISGVPVDGTVVPRLVKPSDGDDDRRALENEAGVKQEWSQKWHGGNTLLHVSGLSPIAAYHQPRMRKSWLRAILS